MSSASAPLDAAIVMCQAAALLAARHLPQYEGIDYASTTKPDVPSGTARVAEHLGAVRRPEPGYPIEELQGPKETRGATLGGAQVHSVHRPTFAVSTEVVFGLPDERLTTRHDAGGRPSPTSRDAASGAEGAGACRTHVRARQAARDGGVEQRRKRPGGAL